MDDTFKVVFADNGVPTMTITDLDRGVTLNRLYFTPQEVTIRLTEITRRLTIKLRMRGFEIAPGNDWVMNDLNGYSVDAVRRRPERYRMLLACGCTVWADYPPLSSHWPCSDHMPDRQRVTSYYDMKCERLIEATHP
jgi:hypothetical protein